MLIYLISLLSLAVCTVNGQLESPCPNIFRYEPRNSSELDRWYGVITVSTDEDLEGIWLKIMLDRKAELLGNWFADAVSKDNTAFSIRNPQYKLEAGPPIQVRFFVKYSVAGIIPTVKKILLNGKTICPNARVPQPTLHLSENVSQDTQSSSSTKITTSTTRRPQSSSRQPEIQKPLASVVFPFDSSSDDGDVFPGDFNVVKQKRPTSRPPVVSTPIQCGVAAQGAKPLISYGQTTSPGEWPWHTAIYESRGTKLNYICGGTLVSQSHVITAAHCVAKLRTNVPVAKDKLVVYLGKYNLISFGSEVQDRQAESIIIHPEYNASTLYNDIAILKLETPVQFNNYVRPCCLWESADNNIENLVGSRGIVVGWGFDQNLQLSINLMQAEMPVISTSECFFSNRDFFSQFLADKNFCVGYRNGTSVCNGDSGGGLVFRRPGTNGQTVWQLRGIVSLAVRSQSGESVCNTEQYSLMTDAAQYVQWIKDTLKQ